jgi:hypothetical protein
MDGRYRYVLSLLIVSVYLFNKNLNKLLVQKQLKRCPYICMFYYTWVMKLYVILPALLLLYFFSILQTYKGLYYCILGCIAAYYFTY